MSDAGILRGHLLDRELAHARRDPGLVREPLTDLIDEEFAEHGAGGRRWDRAAVVGLLASEPAREIRLTHFEVAELAPGIALVTYRSEEAFEGGLRTAWRASVWVERGAGWRMRFHQGTPASSSLEDPAHPR